MGNSEKQIINYGNINNVTDDDNRSYKVYCHIAPNGKMYIGQTYRTIEERAGGINGAGYKGCGHFYNAIQKYGWDNLKHIEIIDGLSKEMADIVETELIKKYNTCDEDYGYNISLGGFGGNGFLFKKTVYQYDLNGNYLKKYDSIKEAQDENNLGSSSIISTALDRNRTSGGYMWRSEYFDHIKPYKYEPSNSKHVYQYDMNGNYIGEFINLKSGAEVIGIARLRPYAYLYEDIFHSCDYLWTFTDRGEKIDDDILDQVLWVISTQGRQEQCVKVYRYDANYNLISVYRSSKDAMLRTGIDYRVIENACIHYKVYDGYIWSYTELDDNLINKYDSILKREPKIVHQYSSDGKLVSTFITQTEAAKSIGLNRSVEISKCCLGKQFTSHGFVWSYFELSKEEVIDKFYQSKLIKSKRKAEEYLNQFK